MFFHHHKKHLPKSHLILIMSLWVDKYRPIELNQCEHVNASVANHLKELVKDGDCPHCASFYSLLLGNFQTLFFFCVLFKILSFSFSFSFSLERVSFLKVALFFTSIRVEIALFSPHSIYSSFSLLQCCFTVRRVLEEIARPRALVLIFGQMSQTKVEQKTWKSARRLREKLKSI